MDIRILNAADVEKLLTVERSIALMRSAMALVADQKTIQPIRQSLRQPDGKGLLSMMPGWTGEPELLGIKVVTVFPDNFGTLFGSHQGFVLLFDTRNGSPIAVLDGRAITAIRTAAATAVATDVLARPDATSLAIFGYGEQAKSHIDALLQVRSFKRVLVWGRNAGKARKFCDEQNEKHDCEFSPAASAEAAAISSDVLCTVTAAAEPFLKGDWLRSGQHLNVVGSSIPTTAEIDDACILRSRVFVDFGDSALELGGDLRNAISSGRITPAHIRGSIGDVLKGNIAGREAASDITMLKSLGMICEDLVSAGDIVHQAVAAGVGQIVSW